MVQVIFNFSENLHFRHGCGTPFFGFDKVFGTRMTVKVLVMSSLTLLHSFFRKFKIIVDANAIL
jgi:hypothetical protein